ncbi:hypothetical protein EM858_13865 [Agrobacterium sp. CNPSo 2736]|nr:hypothetical protein EM858_13865 [Agrobacterium sp. CNPSo 2736]
MVERHPLPFQRVTPEIRGCGLACSVSGSNSLANYIATKSPEGLQWTGIHGPSPKQRFIRGNFSAYVYRQLSVILAPVPRTLKLAGDGEIWHHWQCARSLPPLPTLLEFSFAGTRIFYRLCSGFALPCRFHSG